jgi:DNA-binding NtrC family response regulator
VKTSEQAASKRKNLIRFIHDDDYPAIQEIAKLMLQDLCSHFEIDWACSVDKASEKLTASGHDGTVSKYEMPQKNGPQFLKKPPTQKEENPCTLFTEKGNEELTINALNSHSDIYYNKQNAPKTVYEKPAYSIKQTLKLNEANAWMLQNEIQLQHELTILGQKR